MADVKEIIDKMMKYANPGMYEIGRAIADAQIAYSHLKEMERANKKIISKYGRGAANGTDNYYHPLLQCHLAQMSDDDRVNGILMGIAKEYLMDYPKKRWHGQSHKEIMADATKDLNNNDYGSNIGDINKKRPCVDLLEHMRTENMRNAGIR